LGYTEVRNASIPNELSIEQKQKEWNRKEPKWNNFVSRQPEKQKGILNIKT